MIFGARPRVTSSPSGFTLVELLIVVVILAILAGIVIPQFSSSTSDATLAALDSDLATVRSAIELYRAQHQNVYPGTTTSIVGSCASGSPGTGNAGSAQALADQLQYPSNASGQTCTVASTSYKYGPYLRKGIPTEPVTNAGTVAVTSSGAPIVPGSAGSGWAYDTVSGQFVVNSNAADTNGKLLYTH